MTGTSTFLSTYFFTKKNRKKQSFVPWRSTQRKQIDLIKDGFHCDHTHSICHCSGKTTTMVEQCTTCFGDNTTEEDKIKETRLCQGYAAYHTKPCSFCFACPWGGCGLSFSRNHYSSLDRSDLILSLLRTWKQIIVRS